MQLRCYANRHDSEALCLAGRPQPLLLPSARGAERDYRPAAPRELGRSCGRACDCFTFTACPLPMPCMHAGLRTLCMAPHLRQNALC
jgi:hypothetical protein